MRKPENSEAPEAAPSENALPGDNQGTPVASRRQALKKMGLYAAVAPAMVVLLNGEGNAQGWNGKGNGNSNGPNCDNPGGHLGFNRNGHSAC